MTNGYPDEIARSTTSRMSGHTISGYPFQNPQESVNIGTESFEDLQSAQTDRTYNHLPDGKRKLHHVQQTEATQENSLKHIEEEREHFIKTTCLHNTSNDGDPNAKHRRASSWRSPLCCHSSSSNATESIYSDVESQLQLSLLGVQTNGRRQSESNDNVSIVTCSADSKKGIDDNRRKFSICASISAHNAPCIPTATYRRKERLSSPITKRRSSGTSSLISSGGNSVIELGTNERGPDGNVGKQGGGEDDGDGSQSHFSGATSARSLFALSKFLSPRYWLERHMRNKKIAADSPSEMSSDRTMIAHFNVPRIIEPREDHRVIDDGEQDDDGEERGKQIKGVSNDETTAATEGAGKKKKNDSSSGECLLTQQKCRSNGVWRINQTEQVTRVDRQGSWLTIFDETQHSSIPGVLRRSLSSSTTNISRSSSTRGLDFHGRSKKKNKEAPLRRQLSRRTPRKADPNQSRHRRSVSRSSVRSNASGGVSAGHYVAVPLADLQSNEQSLIAGNSADSMSCKSPTYESLNPLRKVSRALVTAVPAIVRRVSQLRAPAAANQELECLEATPPRYRPVALDQLCRTTHFTKQELQFMYRGFKQECPSGVISEETFRKIYAKLFPVGNTVDDGSGRNTAMYAHYVFGTMDHEGTGQITFGDFIAGLSVLLKGSLAERVTWIFNLYDINNDGYITREELIDVVSSIYDLMSDQTVPRIDDNTAVDHVNRIFDKLDLNRDGVVTMDEFMEYCSKNEEVVHSMNIFNNLPQH